jgi:hypothetical protein
VGTDFKVMQELLRHSSFRSTLDGYTQAVTPAKHAAQAAVISLVSSSDKDEGTSLPDRKLWIAENGQKKARNLPFLRPRFSMKSA